MIPKTKPDFIGEKIRRIRKERGLTQAELSGRIGVIQSDLCRMEKGEYKVGLDVLFRILGVFGMSIAEFFGETGVPAGADAPATPAGLAGPVGAAGESELLRRFRALDAESQAEVLDFLRFKEQKQAHPAKARTT